MRYIVELKKVTYVTVESDNQEDAIKVAKLKIECYDDFFEDIRTIECEIARPGTK